MNLKLERCVRRLEAVFLLPAPQPRETESDRGAQQLANTLLHRIDAVYAAAIRKERKLLKREWQAGRKPDLSRLYLGFSAAVFGHRERNAPLEFPAVVAQAYAQNSGWDYVECGSCRYRFPPGIGEVRFAQCPVCTGAVAPYLGFNGGVGKG